MVSTPPPVSKDGYTREQSNINTGMIMFFLLTYLAVDLFIAVDLSCIWLAPFS